MSTASFKEVPSLNSTLPRYLPCTSNTCNTDVPIGTGDTSGRASMDALMEPVTLLLTGMITGATLELEIGERMVILEDEATTLPQKSRLEDETFALLELLL